MTHPICGDERPEDNTGADVPDPWGPGEEPADAPGPTVLPGQEVTDGELDPGAVPGQPA